MFFEDTLSHFVVTLQLYIKLGNSGLSRLNSSYLMCVLNLNILGVPSFQQKETSHQTLSVLPFTTMPYVNSTLLDPRAQSHDTSFIHQQQ